MMNQRLPRVVGQPQAPGAVRAPLQRSAVSSENYAAAGRSPVPLLIENPFARGRLSQPKAALALKVVTYNIWGLPSWMTGAPSGRYRQIARELERLNADLILLQEAWTAQARESAPANGRWAIARAAGQQSFFQQCGLLTLSRLPILGGKFYPFSRAAFPDSFVNKGVLKVIVQLYTGQVLNVWNVHLQDGGSLDLRQSQVRELLHLVHAAQNGQVADLVGGDFNCTPGSPCWDELVASLGPCLQQISGVPPFVTWDGLSKEAGKGRTLDYIFVRARTAVPTLEAAPRVAFAAADRKQRLSDHLGIEAVLNLLPSANAMAALAEPASRAPVPTPAAREDL